MAAQPAAQSTTISPTTMPLISPPALLQAYLSQSPPHRPSNRAPTETRPIHLNVGSLTHCNGSSLVKVGESTIVCGIRAELLPVSEIPHYRASDNARQGRTRTATTIEEDDDDDSDNTYDPIPLNNLLVPNLELNTNSHPSFPANIAPSTTAQSLSQRLLSLLHSSSVVRASDLSIRHSSEQSASTALDPDDEAYIEPERDVLKAYWTLYIDCVALSYGGEAGMFDAALMAIVAALRDVRLPRARWDEDRKAVLCDANFANARRLRLRGLPCPLGFGVFVPDPRLRVGAEGQGRVNGAVQGKSEGAATVLNDIDSFEDDVCEEKGNVVVDCSNSKNKILKIEKVGGHGRLDAKGMKDVIRRAETRWAEWNAVLETAVRSAG